MSIVWVLVADRSRAKIFHALPEGRPSFVSLAEFEFPEGRQLAQDTESDSPGRLQLRGASRSATEPHTDRAHQTALRFAGDLMKYLNSACHEGRFEKLFIIAPPLFLGTLRSLYEPPLKKQIVLEVDKDLTGLHETDLQRRLGELLQAAPLVR